MTSVAKNAESDRAVRSDEPLLEVRHLQVAFPIWGGILRHKVGEVHAVDDVSFSLARGETLGLVGESGCGKTTIAKAICNILKETAPGVREEGTILFHGPDGPVDLLALGRRKMRAYRAQIQMIFQDPFSSLNPRMTVGEIISRPLKVHTDMDRRQRRQRVEWLLDRVGLAADHASRYPHEFSGGQRQRIGVARALAAGPKLIIGDEPVSALDVSVQAQVINLLQDLQEEFDLTYLFVAHDLSVVHHISDRIAVMYLGNLVEVGTADEVYHAAAHPYTRALLSAVPKPDPRSDRTSRVKLEGEIPSPLAKPTGCPFHPRCPIAREECSTAVPALELQTTGQMAACPYTGTTKRDEPASSATADRPKNTQ
jgi:oligopeptide/dipeptide ABC transporter ATP-binding protein